MTNTQVFRWFCKEQKIMHLIQKMFYKMQPTNLEYKDGQICYRYIDFNEYIDNRVSSYGFTYLLQRILEDYKRKLRGEMSFADYYSLSQALDRKFDKFNKRWEYFVKNNIQVNPNFLKIGDIAKFKDFGDEKTLRIGSIDLTYGRIWGRTIEDDESLERSYGVYTSSLLDNNGKKLPIRYMIKRNRKVYYGAD